MRAKTAAYLVRRRLDWDLSPVEALRLMRTDPHPVALIGSWADGSDVIGSQPLLVRAPPQPLADVLDASCSPEAAAGQITAGSAGQALAARPGSGDPVFGGGWIGYLGFSAAGEALPSAGPRRLPAWWFGYYDHVVRHDQASRRWFFEALWTAGRDEVLERRFEDLSRRAGAPPPQPRGYSCGEFRLIPPAAAHKAAIGQAVDYIRHGDIFQANICLRLEADFGGDPLDAFCRAVTDLRPPFAAFLRPPGGAVASLSPELFLRRTGNTVVSRPIKGTAHRSPRRRRAAAQRGDLERSAKNRAENVMIVDLVRNDLSRVCTVGSVTVPRLLGTEPHPGVWHLVSEVRGTLRAGQGDGDLIRAAFPPGSVTGAPKVRALEIIDELEAAPREVYTGAIGYRSPVAGLELNVAIRTFEFAGGRVWLGSGGGIVADSAADDEYTECLLKAGPLIRALGGRLDSAAAVPAEGEAGGAAVQAQGAAELPHDAVGRPQYPAAAPEAAVVAPANGTSTSKTVAVASVNEPVAPESAAQDPVAGLLLRPRPAAGVFTSLRVMAGEVPGLADHLTRLEASTRELYGKGLPASLAGDLADCLAGRPSGRLRIAVRPVGGPLRALAEVVPLEPSPTAVSLRLTVIPGGLGGHKWLDRRLLAGLARSVGLGPEDHLLITDVDGEVLETDRANVFAVSNGVLHTPPADGRILPGVARDAILRAARRDGIAVNLAPVTVPLLRAASEVFVSNAVHGVLPVRSVDGGSVPRAPGPVTRRVAASLAAQPAASPADQRNGRGTAKGADRGAGLEQAFDAFAVRGRARDDAPAAAEPHPAAGLALPARACGTPQPALAASAQAHAPGVARRRRGRPTVVLIDNYDSFTYNLVHMLVVSGCLVEVVRNDEVTAEQVAAFGPDGVLISPGPCGPDGAGISADVVRACAGSIPVLGVCLGHQAIAAAFGARIVKAPRPVHGQVSDIAHDGRGLLAGLPQPFAATRYHSLIVDERSLPPELVITSRAPGRIPMGLRHTAHQVEGVQFHPESILTADGEKLIRNFAEAARGPRARGDPAGWPPPASTAPGLVGRWRGRGGVQAGELAGLWRGWPSAGQLRVCPAG